MKINLLKISSVVIILLLSIWGGYQIFAPDTPDDIAKDQIGIIKKVITSLDQYPNETTAADTIDALHTYSKEYTKTRNRQQKLNNETINTELSDELNRLSGELFNKSVDLEMSDKLDAADVLNATLHEKKI